jgi:hypothetical protein
MHYEQGWLDLTLGYFDDAHVLRDPGYKAAHWNLPERFVRNAGDGEILVDSYLSRSFMFSGFDADRPEVVTRYSPRLRRDEIGDAGVTFGLYDEAFEVTGWNETRASPYGHARFDNGVPVPEIASEICAGLADAERFGNPFETKSPSSSYRWLLQSAEPQRPVSMLWHAVHGRRRDLQTAFLDPIGSRNAVVRWPSSKLQPSTTYRAS